ncbi:MAG: hypothetical protein ACTS5F_01665 [Candidatus Hodgkinia cicadicola]
MFCNCAAKEVNRLLNENHKLTAQLKVITSAEYLEEVVSIKWR